MCRLKATPWRTILVRMHRQQRRRDAIPVRAGEPGADGMCGLAGRAVLLLACVVAGGAFAATDGQWQLDISGHNTYLYGEPQLGGGLRIPWQVTIRFRISGGEFEHGNGSARMVGEPVALSHPPGWVQCDKVHGSYLDSSLTLHQTPRVRFAAFPVAGEVVDGSVELRPGYRPPGNYLAVTYECALRDNRGSHWFALAERGKQVLGKRQDVEKRVDGDLLQARVREVVGLPPAGVLTLPLQHGWEFAQGSGDDDTRVRYRLSRQP